MTKAEEIYEKHIGSNADLGYIPAIKQDILDAINEALSQHDVSGQSELLKAFADWRDKEGYCTCICDKDIEGFLKAFNCH